MRDVDHRRSATADEGLATIPAGEPLEHATAAGDHGASEPEKLPADLERVKKPTPRRVPLNIRMARAGLNILTGLSLKRALIKAGYAEKTAHNPAANGLVAERCLLEAAKLDPSADPRNLVDSARRVALRQLRSFEGMSERDLRDGKAIGAIHKLWETAERYHGKGRSSESEKRMLGFGERLLELRVMADAILGRGLAPGAPRVLDVTHRTVSHDAPAASKEGAPARVRD